MPETYFISGVYGHLHEPAQALCIEFCLVGFNQTGEGKNNKFFIHFTVVFKTFEALSNFSISKSEATECFI